MLEEGSRKVASKPSPPPFGLEVAKFNSMTVHGIFAEGWGERKKTAPYNYGIYNYSTGRFSYNKGLPTFHHGIKFDWTTGNRKQMVTTYLSDLYVRTFSHRKTCVTNQNISRWYKHSSQKANLSFEKKFKFLKLFSSRKPEYLVGTQLQF